MFRKKRKTNLEGQSASWIMLFNFLLTYNYTIRTSRLQMSFQIGAFKVCKIRRKTPVLESLFSKVTSLEICKFIKKRLKHRCFPVNIVNVLRKLHLKNTTGGWYCTGNLPGIWLHKSGNICHQFPDLCNQIPGKLVKYLFLKIIMNAKQNICFWLKKYSSNAIW